MLPPFRSLPVVLAVLLMTACQTNDTLFEPTVPDSAHNSRNSLDWAGTYSGIIPCADCEGIEVSIKLSYDGSYHRSLRYLGESIGAIEDSGQFQWDSTGSIVSLPSDGRAVQRFKVGENLLFYLDQHGQRITGPLADNYRLLRINP